MSSTRLRTALIGCGQIADAHLQELRFVSSAQTVAVCDLHPDLARQAALRFEIDGIYDDVGTMLEETRPDVVHITTPVQTHAALARQALQAGCHVYLEKPATLNLQEAEQLVCFAGKQKRLLCLGHDQLWDPIWLEARQIVSQHRLGAIRHVESVLGYALQGPFGAQIAADPGHWVRRLPGGLFHNTISHPLYRILDFLHDDKPRVWAEWFSMEGDAFPTELRVLLRGATVTGTLTFSSRIMPQRVARLYGRQGWLEVDLDAHTLRLNRPSSFPGPFGILQTAWRQSGEARRRKWRTLGGLLRSDLLYFGGMRTLFTEFYQAIEQGGTSPIPGREILRHAWVMDEIIRCCASSPKC
jgi:predicted dehydrogenase